MKQKTMPDEKTADAAVKFRDSLVPKADQMVHGKFPLWHGWALYEAFIAGAAFEQKKRGRK